MQKISSYLYPNRVEVEADRQSSVTEWKIVYQRRLKIYQGMNNTIEFDFKNSQQRRTDVTGVDIFFVLTDSAGKQIKILQLDQTDKKGIATLTIPRNLLSNIVPQFLTYSLYTEDEYGNKTIVYADTQFGAAGNIELIAGVYPFFEQLNHFDEVNGKYVSDIVEFDMLDDAIIDLSHFSLTFEFSGLSAVVSVFASNDPVVDENTQWVEVEVFEVEPNITAITKQFVETRDFPNNLRWLQISYDPMLDNTGTLDTVVIIA